MRQMLLIRHFEERVVRLFHEGLIRGATHVYLGEEAIAVGACRALRPDDYITSTHRGHGHCIAKGADVRFMMAELLGKESGYCRGRGGSMHIADIHLGILGANGIVGGGIPIAVGAGLASDLLKQGRVCLCFFGCGATNQGTFHESLNLAAVWKLPVVFLIENNRFAVTTPLCESTAIEDLCERAASYGIDGVAVDGNDVLEVYEEVAKAVQKARAGGGPTLIEARTYRWEGHYLGDPQVYREKEDVERWKQPDREPVQRFWRFLTEGGFVSDEELRALDAECLRCVDEAEAFARASADPDPARLEEDLFAPPVAVPPEEEIPPATEEVTYLDAINRALDEALEDDERVVLFGEDIGLHGGPFQVTKGLWKKHGGHRVRNTPISEAAIAGAAVGASLCGARPVAEIMYLDFMTIAMDQVVNQAAKIRYMFGGKAKLPLVIRTQCGIGMGGGPHHSQSLEAWFYHVPGLKVVIPSTPYDAKGLLATAIAEENPVLFIEFKRLYHTKGKIPQGRYMLPFGVASVKREGRDATVVAWGPMVLEALAAAAELAAEGIELEVVDPRTLVPLDEEAILASVRKTGRALVVHEAVVRGGVGADIAALIQEKAFDWLDAPVKRLGSAHVPMPYAVPLERAALVRAPEIAAAARALVRG